MVVISYWTKLMVCQSIVKPLNKQFKLCSQVFLLCMTIFNRNNIILIWNKNYKSQSTRLDKQILVPCPSEDRNSNDKDKNDYTCPYWGSGNSPMAGTALIAPSSTLQTYSWLLQLSPNGTPVPPYTISVLPHSITAFDASSFGIFSWPGSRDHRLLTKLKRHSSLNNGLLALHIWSSRISGSVSDTHGLKPPYEYRFRWSQAIRWPLRAFGCSIPFTSGLVNTNGLNVYIPASIILSVVYLDIAVRKAITKAIRDLANYEAFLFDETSPRAAVIPNLKSTHLISMRDRNHSPTCLFIYPKQDSNSFFQEFSCLWHNISDWITLVTFSGKNCRSSRARKIRDKFFSFHNVVY